MDHCEHFPIDDRRPSEIVLRLSESADAVKGHSDKPLGRMPVALDMLPKLEALPGTTLPRGGCRLARGTPLSGWTHSSDVLLGAQSPGVGN